MIRYTQRLSIKVSATRLGRVWSVKKYRLGSKITLFSPPFSCSSLLFSLSLPAMSSAASTWDKTSAFPAYWSDDDIDAAFPTIMDFPAPDIAFRDITPFMATEARHACLQEWARRIQDPAAGIVTADLQIDGIVYLEARGWILSPVEAYFPNKPAAIMARKPGKLPGKTVSQAYGYEYAQSVLHVAAGSIVPGKRYLILDDVAVTLGTAAAACKLVTACKGIVAGVACLLSIKGLAKADALSCPFVALFEVPLVSRNAIHEVQPVLRAISDKSPSYEPNSIELHRKTGIARNLPQPCVLFADPVQQYKIEAIAAYLPQLFRTGLLTERTFPDKVRKTKTHTRQPTE
jgi:adenine phosphoribosyltransferase